MSVAYIALGSNVGDRLAYLRSGKDKLARIGDLIAISPVYDTEPVGMAEGDCFLNAAISICTELKPEELLSKYLDIERTNGRLRSYRNAPRTLDIDLLLYDDLIVNTPRLKLPHPRMHERAFVLAPLADIAPAMLHPTLRKPMQELLDCCPPQEVTRTNYSL
ncbi:MAG TPA: 2-amino-4-hydroxy-6-hydroxymethyldihydropteridine diphosphokinase [Candidatus Paceibacterota bacterium]|jgi:2-amino-4-hydroxy-6-hydroxymethyldihydropteridine diphosphokinase|nr:2-amino-4-hydroxy-6-hydroxymethyldihydropteridine diphosphokinase [Candidatus Paceibacterota bacterium]